MKSLPVDCSESDIWYPWTFLARTDGRRCFLGPRCESNSESPTMLDRRAVGIARRWAASYPFPPPFNHVFSLPFPFPSFASLFLPSLPFSFLRSLFLRFTPPLSSKGRLAVRSAPQALHSLPSQGGHWRNLLFSFFSPVHSPSTLLGSSSWHWVCKNLSMCSV